MKTIVFHDYTMYCIMLSVDITDVWISCYKIRRCI